MHGMGKTVNEMHAMLKLHEQTLTKKDAVLHEIRAGKVQKKNNKQKKSDNAISVSRNNLVYFSVVSMDGIFEIDLSDFDTNDSSMYAVSKRANLNLDSALLWHCRLRHISKKRIEKLQHDGLLNLTHLRAFEKCVSCMSGNMAQKPYTRQVERDKYLLGLIHTDGIIAHRTPPYTPQHNGMSERRNGTLLDMVRSMMSQTTLSKSFWNYALETAARILNMVLTKKVEKTSYEVHKDTTCPWSYVLIHIRAIRILIAIATFYDYEIWQMDVKTAFLNGYLSEEVFMEQHEGFVNPKYPNRVCKLKRFIYGLKQASRQWNKRFDDEIKKFDFTQNRDQPCVYLKASGSNVTFLILYVDDILITGNNILMLQDVKSYLGMCFTMKDLGEAAYILGIKIYIDRSRRLIGLCQSAYVEKILKRFHMKNSKHGNIPMQEKLRLSKSQSVSTLDAVVVRDFYKKFYNSLGIVPNSCSSSIGKTQGCYRSLGE
nr:putative retrotransposon protein [Tanacetum cinerariifolium]